MKKFLLIILLILINCKEKIKNKTSEENNNLDKAIEFRNSGNEDSAYVYYVKAKEELLRDKNNTEAARAIVNIAIIECNKGDYHSSITNSIEAEKLLKNKKDSTALQIASSNYNSIAIASKNLKNYSQAIDYYKLAIKKSQKKTDSLAFYNNIGDTYLEQKNNKTAKSYFKTALQTTDSIDYARALNNLAKANFSENPFYDAYPDLEKSLQIRIRQKDNKEITSSFATLADFYFKKNPEKSLLYINEMYKIALKNKNPDDQLEALNKIILLDTKDYPQNFNRYISLRDSVQSARNNDFQRFGLIKFDVEKQKRSNEELKAKNFRQIIGIVFLVLALIATFIWYRKRRQRLLLESENKLKEQQLKTSKKVHDVVANGIYQVMTKIENQDDFNKEQALDELEFVYEKSRDISYENPDSEDEKFNEKISKLVASFKNDEVKTFTVGNQEENWEKVTASTQTEIYQIIRELLVNMKKHSKASNVIFKFEKIDNLMYINYADNGIGIRDELIFKNGLSNTVSRIENINGKITFETKIEKGLKINISFPVS
ncbi:tetratricopeptide repeat-containing sensor histidine kinase [Chryseobacterium terrae]|uniref:Tetratricopeptide repeat-containing protein n=1 Tax=Chryseobacterium terrae TaxID=3163299 RepID=A0ABW8Y185_9FLAO